MQNEGRILRVISTCIILPTRARTPKQPRSRPYPLVRSTAADSSVLYLVIDTSVTLPRDGGSQQIAAASLPPNCRRIFTRQRREADSKTSLATERKSHAVSGPACLIIQLASSCRQIARASVGTDAGACSLAFVHNTVSYLLCYVAHAP